MIGMLKNFVKWFDINCGWFFINGRKRAAWAEYLRKKYGKEETKKPTRITFSPTPKCLICKTDMETIKLNQPFCGECLSVLTGLVKNKNGENSN